VTVKRNGVTNTLLVHIHTA